MVFLKNTFSLDKFLKILLKILKITCSVEKSFSVFLKKYLISDSLGENISLKTLRVQRHALKL